MVNIVSAGLSDRARLSANYLRDNTDWPELLRNDYIGGYSDSSALYNNDQALADAVDQNTADIDQNASDISQNSSDIATNAAGIAQNASDISVNAANIATNASNISTNTTNISQNTSDIAQNASDIADINDGRYSPQFGTGSPEGVVTANRNQTYFDTSVPAMWVNPAIGASTGWVQIV